MHNMNRHKSSILILLMLSCVLLPSRIAHAADRELIVYSTEFAGFMGGSEPNPGLLIEMVQRAAQKQSYSVMQKIVPWARAIRMARTEANGAEKRIHLV
jgi:hypothetical protein